MNISKNNKYNILQEVIKIMKKYPGFVRLSSSYIKDPKFLKFLQYIESLKELKHYYESDLYAEYYVQRCKKLDKKNDQVSYYAIFPENLKLNKNININKKKPDCVIYDINRKKIINIIKYKNISEDNNKNNFNLLKQIDNYHRSYIENGFCTVLSINIVDTNKYSFVKRYYPYKSYYFRQDVFFTNITTNKGVEKEDPLYLKNYMESLKSHNLNDIHIDIIKKVQDIIIRKSNNMVKKNKINSYGTRTHDIYPYLFITNKYNYTYLDTFFKRLHYNRAIIFTTKDSKNTIEEDLLKLEHYMRRSKSKYKNLNIYNDIIRKINENKNRHEYNTKAKKQIYIIIYKTKKLKKWLKWDI